MLTHISFFNHSYDDHQKEILRSQDKFYLVDLLSGREPSMLEDPLILFHFSKALLYVFNVLVVKLDELLEKKTERSCEHAAEACARMEMYLAVAYLLDFKHFAFICSIRGMCPFVVGDKSYPNATKAVMQIANKFLTDVWYAGSDRPRLAPKRNQTVDHNAVWGAVLSNALNKNASMPPMMDFEKVGSSIASMLELEEAAILRARAVEEAAEEAVPMPNSNREKELLSISNSAKSISAKIDSPPPPSPPANGPCKPDRFVWKDSILNGLTEGEFWFLGQLWDRGRMPEIELKAITRNYVGWRDGKLADPQRTIRGYVNTINEKMLAQNIKLVILRPRKTVRLCSIEPS